MNPQCEAEQSEFQKAWLSAAKTGILHKGVWKAARRQPSVPVEKLKALKIHTYTEATAFSYEVIQIVFKDDLDKLIADSGNVQPSVQAVACIWTKDECGVYDTSCGGRFSIAVDTPAENDMKFCPYCGAALIAEHGNVRPSVPDTDAYTKREVKIDIDGKAFVAVIRTYTKGQFVHRIFQTVIRKPGQHPDRRQIFPALRLTSNARAILAELGADELGYIDIAEHAGKGGES